MSDEKNACSLDVSDDELVLSNRFVRVSYSINGGTLSFYSKNDSMTYFEGAHIQIETNVGIIDSRQMEYQSFATIDIDDPRGKVIAIKLRARSGEIELGVRISIVEGLRGFTCITQLRNQSREPIRLQHIDQLVIDLDEYSIITGIKGSDVKYFKNGLHSWILSQIQDIDAGENISHFYTVLHNIRSRDALVFGYTTATNQMTTIRIIGDDNVNGRLTGIKNRCHLDDIVLDVDSSVTTEELLVLAGRDAYQLLNEYVKRMMMQMQAISCSEVPVGWCSWYFYLTQPDEGEVIENARFLQRRLPEHIRWIQLDDGYQKTVGDWTTNERFANGLERLVRTIESMGFKAGIWVAPFIATEPSDVFKRHPDWFVKDDDGNPLVVDQNPLWLGNYYAFDLTQMEVLAYIESVFKELKRVGFDYFKIDFLYHAVVEGQRLDDRTTRAALFRKGLDVIRRAVGDSIILGCGAPIVPCVGFVNAMRIGTDIATAWRYDWGGGVYECSINTMTRAVMHNRLWINDPDCILVRQDDNELTIDEVILWATVVAMSGGIVMLSDRMMDVSDERLHIIDRILPVYHQGAISLDYLDEPEPRLFALPIKTGFGVWVILAVVNLTSEPIDLRIPLSRVGLVDDRAHIFEFWGQEYLGVHEMIKVLQLPSHSCRLLGLRPVLERPDLLGTSAHFTQGAMEIEDVNWDESSNKLTLSIARDLRHVEEIHVSYPENYSPVSVMINGNSMEFRTPAHGVVSVIHQFRKRDRVIISFQSV